MFFQDLTVTDLDSKTVILICLTSHSCRQWDMVSNTVPQHSDWQWASD